MSNLGRYQDIVKWSKAVGGPNNFIALVAGSGAVAGATAIYGIYKHREKHNMLKGKAQSPTVYVVDKAGKSNDGLEFFDGDKFKVLEVDGDAVLIEKIGDQNNPYFVSATFLKSVSDYR